MDRISNTIIERTDNINRLFADIRGEHPMTNEEEVAVFARIADGDSTARDSVVTRNMLFVIARAKTYTRNPNTLDDLIQEGTIGLIDAIGRFDCSKGFRFISFAVYYIDLYIRQFLFGDTIVRQSNDRKIAPKVRQIRSRFLELNQREPSEWEIAEILESEFGIEVKDLRDLAPVAVTNLDAEVGEEDCTALDCGEIATRTASENIFVANTEAEADLARCNKLMERLTPKEREIVDLAYGLTSRVPMNNEVIGEKYGCTAERIRQILRKAEKKMRA